MREQVSEGNRFVGKFGIADWKREKCVHVIIKLEQTATELLGRADKMARDGLALAEVGEKLQIDARKLKADLAAHIAALK